MKSPADSFREIERRFLLDALPLEEIARGTSARLAQGYLTGHPVTVRLRQIGADQFFLTIKRGSLPNREEREVTLTPGQFEALWPMTAGWRIEKVRHSVPFGGLIIEIDVFEGRHSGLIIAEVEFPSLEDSEEFIPPVWFGREITADAAFSNSRLSEPAP